MADKYKSTAELSACFRLALPLVAALLAQVGMDVIDSVMLGQLGPDALAAGALALAIYIFLFVACLGFSLVSGILMARAYGANDELSTTYIFHQSIWLSTFLSIPCMLILWHVPNFLDLINHDPTLVRHTAYFMHFLQWSMLPALWFIALREFVAVLGRARIVSIISVLAIPLNGIGDYGLMYGKWGLPQLGIAGIGLATTLVSVLMFFALLIYVLLQPRFNAFAIIKRFSLPKWRYLKETLILGTPVSITLVFEVGLFSISSLMMGEFGHIQLAAHQIALQCGTAAFMIPLGISQAAGLRVGHAMGRDDPQAAQLSGYVATLLGLLCSVITISLFVFWPRGLAELYIQPDTPAHLAVINYAVHFLRIAAVFQFFDVIQVIMNGALRGMKDTFIPMLLGMVSYWLVGLLGGYFFAFVLGWQGVGLWWGLAVGILASALLLWQRFHLSTQKQIQSYAHGNLA